MATRPYKETVYCRACGSADLSPAFSLGDLHLNAFPGRSEPDTPKAPLTLLECVACGLVQLSASVDRDLLYRSYHYRSATNETIAQAVRDAAHLAQTFVQLEPGDYVLDIGCNDGTLLEAYPRLVHCWGVDPSDITRNRARVNVSEEKPFRHLNIVCDYFPITAIKIDPLPCKIVSTIATLYDVDDLRAFAAEVHRWLHPQGVWIIEVANAERLFAAGAFDTICHEHVCYFDAFSLHRLLTSNDFQLLTIENTPTNGGSLRVVARARPTATLGQTRGAYDWKTFGDRLSRARVDTRRYLANAKANGRLVLGAGASTKANTLLQYFGLDPWMLPAIGDRQPEKVGRQTVGTRIPIISEEEMRERQPYGLLVLPWHLLDSIAERERALVEAGCQLAAPLPSFTLRGATPA